MAKKRKKDFGMENALDFLVSGENKDPKDNSTKNKESKKTYTTVTVRIQDHLLPQVKAVAYWKRRKIQDIYNKALENYLSSIDPKTLEKALQDYKDYLEDE